MEPAAISARPAVTTMPLDATAPVRPAASANGTVSPSDIPMTTSRSESLPWKWRSTCGVCGMRPLALRGGAGAGLVLGRVVLEVVERVRRHAERAQVGVELPAVVPVLVDQDVEHSGAREVVAPRRLHRARDLGVREPGE